VIDRQRTERYRAEQHDSRVRSGRILAEIGEFDVQRQKNAVLAGGTSGHLDIRAGQQVFIRRSQYIMAESDQDRLEMAGEILVKLQSHVPTAVFHKPSWAKSAA
jgi:hypothetical protein